MLFDLATCELLHTRHTPHTRRPSVRGTSRYR
jgi:hypothetical protein